MEHQKKKFFCWIFSCACRRASWLPAYVKMWVNKKEENFSRFFVVIYIHLDEYERREKKEKKRNKVKCIKKYIYNNNKRIISGRCWRRNIEKKIFFSTNKEKFLCKLFLLCIFLLSEFFLYFLSFFSLLSVFF